jgi:hypothetical protein
VVETIHRDDKTKRNCESPRPSQHHGYDGHYRRYDNGNAGYHGHHHEYVNHGHHYRHHGCVNRDDHRRYHRGEHYWSSDHRRR